MPPRRALAPAHAESPAPAGRPPAFDPGPWEDQIADTSDPRALRKIGDDANGRGFLDRKLSNGETMRAVLLERTTDGQPELVRALAAIERDPDIHRVTCRACHLEWDRLAATTELAEELATAWETALESDNA